MREKTNPYSNFIYKCYLTNQNIKKLLQEEKRSVLIKLKTHYENADSIIKEYRQRCFNVWLIAESFKNFYYKSSNAQKRYIAYICIGKCQHPNGKYQHPNGNMIEKMYERLIYEISKNNISK